MISLSCLTWKPAKAIGYSFTCESLLAAAMDEMPRRLLAVDSAAAGIREYRSHRAQVGESRHYFTFEKSVHPLVLEEQLHRSIDAIVQHSMTFPENYTTSASAAELNKLILRVKDYASLWVVAYTDPETHTLKIGDRTLEASSNFANREQLALKAMTPLIDARRSIKGTKFSALYPVPPFIIGDAYSNWILKMIPSKNNDGYQLVIINRIRSLAGRPESDPNDLFARVLAEQVFHHPTKVTAANVAYEFLNDFDTHATKFGDMISTIRDLNRETFGRVDTLQIRRAFAIGLNLKMLEILRHHYQFMHKISPKLVKNYLDSHPEALSQITTEADGSYLSKKNGDLFRYFFYTLSVDMYNHAVVGQDVPTRLFGWSQFTEIARALHEDFDESVWQRAMSDIQRDIHQEIPELYRRAGNIYHSDLFSPNEHDFFFDDRIHLKSISLRHDFDFAIFDGETAVEDLPVHNLQMTLASTQAALEHGDLRGDHMRLLVERIAEQLRHHANYD